MPVYLMLAITVGVFMVCAAAFLLILALMRVGEMRRALVEAGRRIAALEENVALLRKGVLIAEPAPTRSVSEALAPPAARALREPAVAALNAPAAQSAPPLLEPEPFARAPFDWSWLPSVAAGLAAVLLIAALNRLIAPLTAVGGAFGIGALIAMSAALAPSARGAMAPVLGFAAMAAAVLVAGWLGIGSPPLLYLGLAALTVLAVAAGPWGGGLVMFAGVAVGASAPLMIDVGEAGGALRHGHLVALTASALAAAAVQPALRTWSLIAVACALAWGVAGAIQGVDAAPAYLAALGALGLALWWPESGAPISWRRPHMRLIEVREPARVGMTLLGAGCAFLLMTELRAAPEMAAMACLAVIALAAISHVLAALRPGFSLAAATATLTGVFGVALWPDTARFPFVGLEPAEAALAAAALLAAVSVAGGWGSLTHGRRRAEAIGFAGIAPLTVLGAAAVRLQGADAQWIGAGALVIAISSLVLAYALAPAPDDGAPRRPDRAALAVAGAAAAFAVTSAAPAEWLTIALAALVPAFIWIDRRREGAALALSGLIIALVVLYRLATPWTAAEIAVAETPLFNMLTPIYLGSALAFWLGAKLLQGARWPRAGFAAQCLEAGAWIAGALWANVQLRHGFGGGDVTAPLASLTELGLHACVWLAVALAIRFEVFGARNPVVSGLEAAAIILAAGLSGLGAGWLANPWWGVWPASAPDAPVVNALLVAFAAPAALLLVWGLQARSEGRPELARLAGATAGCLVLVNVILELRRGFVGAAMATVPAGAVEQMAYTLAMIAFAAGLLALGLERRSQSLRIGSLVIAALAVAKFAVIDLSTVDSALRFLGVILALAMGATLVWFYQHHVFQPPRPARPSSEDRAPQK